MAFRVFLGLLVPLLFSTSSWADDINLNPNHPQQYTVKKGDTLWGIAGKFLQDPRQWPIVWKNNTQIENPNLIYPGDTIYFAVVDGKPQLSLTQFPASERSAATEDFDFASTKASTGEDRLFYPHARETPIEEAIKLIPVESIAPFLSSPRVVGKTELEKSPYVIDVAGEHLVGGAGDRIYARAIKSADNLVYTVFRQGEAYRHPKTQEILGYEAEYIATSTLQKTGDPATLVVTESDREVRRGDRLISSKEGEIALNYFPRPPETKIAGNIINVMNGVTEIGQYDIVVIDKGKSDGLESGHVLDIFQQRRAVHDPYALTKNELVDLPEEFSGTLLIFRPFERVSYALVMNATNAIHLLDKVATP